jgi:hypothetical protein
MMQQSREDDREDLRNNIPDGSGSYSNPMYNYAGSIIEITDTEALFLRLESSLRGVVINGRGEKVTQGEPLLNDDGVKDIVMIMRSIGDRASVMSHFDTNEIKALMEYLNDTLAKVLMMNKVNYDITNPSARDLIVFMCNGTAFAIIKRGFEGGERRFWKGSQIDYNVKSTDGGRKGGWLSGIFKR